MAAEIQKPNDAVALRVREGSLAMQFGQAGLQLRNLEDAIAFGKQMVDSGFAPKGVTKASSVVWIVQRGAELGIGPISSLDSFYVGPSGKPELFAKAALGVCIAHGALDPEYDLETEGTGDTLTAVFTFKRKGWSKSKTRRFTFAEAKTAGLTGKDNWKNWPQRLVQARVVSFALKDYLNDVLMGCAIEGDHDHEPIQGQITEISREILPAAPDPLFAQFENKVEPEIAGSNGGGDWDFLEDAPKVEPEVVAAVEAPCMRLDCSIAEAHPCHPEAVEPGAPTPLIDMPVPLASERVPPRVHMASKENQDKFYSLCRERGLNDMQIMTRLGTAGFETIDQVPADVLAEMTRKVEAFKPIRKK